MRIFIPLIFASLVITSCGNNEAKIDTQQTNSPKEDEVVCQIHNKHCLKTAIEMCMSLDEYHKWQDEQLSSIKEEDEMTDANGDIIDPNQPTQTVYNCDWCGGEYDNKGFLADKYGKVEEVSDFMDEQRKSMYAGGYTWFCSQKCAYEYVNR